MTSEDDLMEGIDEVEEFRLRHGKTPGEVAFFE